MVQWRVDTQRIWRYFVTCAQRLHHPMNDTPPGSNALSGRHRSNLEPSLAILGVPLQWLFVPQSRRSQSPSGSAQLGGKRSVKEFRSSVYRSLQWMFLENWPVPRSQSKRKNPAKVEVQAAAAWGANARVILQGEHKPYRLIRTATHGDA
jgi:hypothetical protein